MAAALLGLFSVASPMPLTDTQRFDNPEPLDTCFNLEVGGTGEYTYLKGQCHYKDSNTFDITTINLNHCLGNCNGALIPRDEGKAGNTCRNFAIDDKQVISADCEDNSKDHTLKNTSIHAGDIIKSDDGTLVCYTHKGCTTTVAGTSCPEDLMHLKQDVQQCDDYVPSLESCYNIEIEGEATDLYFNAECRLEDESGSKKGLINLSHCFANFNGEIVPQKEGDFGSTCKSFQWGNSDRTINAMCQDKSKDNAWHYSSVS